MAFSFLTQELAIDLGTANTVIFVNDKIVVDEPSIQANQLHTVTEQDLCTRRHTPTSKPSDR